MHNAGIQRAHDDAVIQMQCRVSSPRLVLELEKAHWLKEKAQVPETKKHEAK
jgi:hypothetical protein